MHCQVIKSKTKVNVSKKTLCFQVIMSLKKQPKDLILSCQQNNVSAKQGQINCVK